MSECLQQIIEFFGSLLTNYSRLFLSNIAYDSLFCSKKGFDSVFWWISNHSFRSEYFSETINALLFCQMITKGFGKDFSFKYLIVIKPLLKEKVKTPFECIKTLWTEIPVHKENIFEFMNVFIERVISFS